MCRYWFWFHYDLRVCTELQILSKTASCLWFYAYKKYKNSNSARRTCTQRHILPAICSGRSDNFSSGISGKLQKIANFKTFFLRMADRIAMKFLHDNLKEDQAQWHISKLCSFYYTCSTLKHMVVIFIFHHFHHRITVTVVSMWYNVNVFHWLWTMDSGNDITPCDPG